MSGPQSNLIDAFYNAGLKVVVDGTRITTELVENERVNTAFFKTGENKVELLESTDPDGVIAKFIAKKGQGLHHIAFEVDDIVAEMRRLQQAGFTLLQEEPKKGADNKLICFLHPQSTQGVLIEICQEIR
jgi:methylmalonyl-CoA/ethylmalonyl-CoA epimerase